ncbi:SDR family oxidoreductase [bacterium]|nr:MAG: SDR family oxidoreductase [bacterium]
MLLDGKVAIVTGGARGIGRDICRVLARQGAKVVVNYAQSRDRAEAVVREIEAEGGTATAFGADVRDLAQYEAMVAHAIEAHGRLDAVINNAIAGKQDGKFAEASDEDFANAFDYGCRAIANSVRAVMPTFTEQGGGRIVNIVTELWNMAPGGWSVYLAGKGAMVGLSRSLAEELGPHGITVNMVAPGWMATEKVDTTSEGSIKFGQSLPLRRHGSGEEIGNACAFFLSDLAGYVTGAYLPVTGGRITQMGA